MTAAQSKPRQSGESSELQARMGVALRALSVCLLLNTISIVLNLKAPGVSEFLPQPTHVLSVFLGLGALLSGVVAIRVFGAAKEVTGEFDEKRRLNQHLELVARRTSNAVVIADRDGRIQWVNEGFTRISGYTFDEVRGTRPGSVLQGGKTSREAVARMRNALTAHRGFNETVLNYRKNGEEYWIAIDGQPLTDEDGVVNGFMAVETDVTANVRLNEQLAAQSARIDLALRAGSMAVWEWDAQTGMFDYDAQAASVFGIPSLQGSFKDQDWRQRIHPDDRAAFEARQREALERGTEFTFELRVISGDGLVRHLQSAAVVVRNPDGTPLKMIGVLTDLTRLKDADERRRVIDERLRRITESVPAVLFEYHVRADGTSSMTYASPGLRTIFGIDPESVSESAASLLRAVHSDDRARVLAGLASSQARRAPWNDEFRIVHPQRGVRWVGACATSTDGADGTSHWYGFINDVTAERDARDRVIEISASLEEAQELARLGSWSFDIATMQVQWSRQMYQIYGRDETLGPPDFQAAMDYYTPEDRSLLVALVERAMRTGESYDLTLHMKERIGDIGVVQANGKVLRDLSGRVVKLFGTVMDVTASVEREEALMRAQERALAASSAKSDFLANMSHEIRTPMTAILGYLDLLSEPDLTPSDRAQYTRTVQRNAEHLLEVINQVLDLSKIEAGQVRVEQVSCDPVALVRDVVALMRPRADEKALALTLRFEGLMPSTILTDPTRLRQILINLVGNALKFTSVGRVDVEVRLLGDDEPALEMAVVDTGIGIEPDVVEYIFSPFSQADTSTTRKFGGTGLGLSIALRLAQLLGGGIDVRSTPGKGSTFVVRVATGSLEHVTMSPCREESRRPLPYRPRPAEGMLAGLKILLAEDGPDNQGLIALHLRRAGASVEIVDDGSKAVSRLLPTPPHVEVEHGGFDVVLMDMQMPVLDGYAATKRLRASGYAGVVIALTAHAMENDRQKCLDAGCDDYVTKPVDTHQLAAVILRHAQTAPRGQESAGRPSVVAFFSEYESEPEMALLVQGFVTGLPDRLAAIENAFRDGEFGRFGTLVHQLRGAGGGYGFPAISQAAAHLEELLKGRATVELQRTALDDLGNICRSSKLRQGPANEQEGPSRRWNTPS